jgi:hypothetical protein
MRLGRERSPIVNGENSVVIGTVGPEIIGIPSGERNGHANGQMRVTRAAD